MRWRGWRTPRGEPQARARETGGGAEVPGETREPATASGSSLVPPVERSEPGLPHPRQCIKIPRSQHPTRGTCGRPGARKSTVQEQCAGVRIFALSSRSAGLWPAVVHVVQMGVTSVASALGRGGQGCPQRQLAGAERLRIMLARQHGSPLPLARAQREDVRSTNRPAPSGVRALQGRTPRWRPPLAGGWISRSANHSGYRRTLSSFSSERANPLERSWMSATSTARSAD